MESLETPDPRAPRNPLSRGLVWLLVGGVKLYRLTLQAWLGGHCRFEPSCSQYFMEAVEKHGPCRGTLRGLWRICRCHPLCRGGYDPP